MNLLLLTIDPGEKCGFTVLAGTNGDLTLVDAWEWTADDPGKAAIYLYHLYNSVRPTAIISEDYRIYASAADEHIGQRLKTAELLGVIEGVAGLFIPPIQTYRLPAQKKKRWPEKRLDSKFQTWRGLKGLPHALDSLKLALAWAEGTGVWTP